VREGRRTSPIHYGAKDIADNGPLVTALVPLHRVIIFSLILNSIFALWDLFPEDDSLSIYTRLLWESMMTIASVAALSAVLMYGVLEQQMQYVSNVNVKAFVLMMSQPWFFAEILILLSGLTLWFGMAVVGYHRLCIYTPQLETYTYALTAFNFIIVSLTLVCLQFIEHVTLRGGMMEGLAVARPLRNDSAVVR